MYYHKISRTCNYTPAQLFALVIDIESYPDFLPWCKKAQIIKTKENIIIAQLTIEFAGIAQSYTSKVTHTLPNKIAVEMIDGPFVYLFNNWQFDEQENGLTTIDFEIDFKFSSKILETLIGVIFDKTVTKLTEAFLKRADHIYSKQT